MEYWVMTRVGDYPVDNQSCWGISYPNIDLAMIAALSQHKELEPKWGGDKTYHTMVLTGDVDESIAVMLLCGDAKYFYDEAERYAKLLEEEANE